MRVKIMSFTKLCFAVFLISCCFSSATAFYNSISQFRSFIRPLCYADSPGARLSQPSINGQEKPLSQTFENFLYLVEKIELANNNLHLQDILKILLKNYTFENLVRIGKQYQQAQLSGTEEFLIKDLWGSDFTVVEHVNPLSDDETCSLFSMLSHTVDNQPAFYEDESKLYTPVGKDGVPRAAEKVTKHPRENGTILIRPGADTIALSRVILGLYLGLTAEPKTLDQILTTNKKGVTDLSQSVSLLHVFTLVDILVYDSWPTNEDIPMGPFSEYKAIFNDGYSSFPNSICPTIFNLPEGASSLYTYSFLKGGADGLILGSIAKDIVQASQYVKLSQILRSYYSRQGIQLQAPTDTQSNESNKPLVSYCNREDLLNLDDMEIEKSIKQLVTILATDNELNDETEQTAITFLKDHKREIFGLKDTSVCSGPAPADDLPCETPVELIIVLDSQSKRIDRQRELVGVIANKLNMYPGGSSLTVLLDQFNSTSELNLMEYQPRTFSSAEAACHLVQENIDEKGISREKVIRGLSNFLSNRKSEDKELIGAPGKIVLYFNFAEEENFPAPLEQEIRSFFRKHNDIRMFAVGENEKVLERYVGLNKKGYFRLVDKDTEKLANDLVNRICLGPADFQFSNCADGKGEERTVFEAYVTKGSVQYWALKAQYFVKSFGAKVFFDTDTGNNVRACHSRTLETKPQDVATNCQNSTSKDRRLEFGLKNPCSGMSEQSCAPAYYAVIGSDSRQEDQFKVCTDTDCKSLNQVKFRFLHEGIRCSGASAVFVSTFLVLVSLLFSGLMK